MTRQKASAPLPAAKVAHSSPGRLRLRVQKGHRSNQAITKLSTAAAEIPGVKAVEHSVDSGSVLIIYNPHDVRLDRLLSQECLGRHVDCGPDVWDAARAAPEAAELDPEVVMRGLLYAGAAAIGAAIGPRVGLSPRLGSIILSAIFIAVERIIQAILPSLARFASDEAPKPDRLVPLADQA